MPRRSRAREVVLQVLYEDDLNPRRDLSVADLFVRSRLKNDAELWSGCISGALTEEGFLQAFEDAGFYGIRILERQAEPWQTVEGIEFRSLTVEAYKGKEGPCWERRQAVVYRGPFREVLDDDGHRYRRGERTAVCDKIYRLLQDEPYRGSVEPVPPRVEVPLEQAGEFDCSCDAIRDPRQTKGDGDRESRDGSSCCSPKGE